LEVLRSSTLKHVTVLGRRGPLEAKFGNKEVREMMALDGVGFIPPASETLQVSSGVKPDRKQTRFLSLLKGGSSTSLSTASKNWELKFFQSPTELSPTSSPDRHGSQYNLKISHTALSAIAPSDPSMIKPDTVAIPTTNTSITETDLLVTSLGQLTSTLSLHDPLSNKALKNLFTTANRIYTSSNRLIKNVYTSGWAAIGARGVLNTTLMDAYSVSNMILSENHSETSGNYIPPTLTPHPTEPPLDILPNAADLQEEVPPLVLEGIRDGVVTTYDDWKVVDDYELKEGRTRGKERLKLMWNEVLEKGLLRR